MSTTLGQLLVGLAVQPDQKSFNDASKALSSLKSTLMKGLGMLGIGLSIKGLISIADEFNQINDRIAYAAGEVENLDEVQKSIKDSASECRVSYGEMAESVTSLKQANEDVFPLETGTEFVECVNKLGKTAGYSNRELSSMMTSVQRMAASGALSVNDLQRTARSTPAFLEAIADGLGVDTEQLQEMAKSGKLTAETVRDAILNSKEDIDLAFQDLDYGIEDALTSIRNDWGFFVNDVNQGLKITQTVAEWMVGAFRVLMGWMTKAQGWVMQLANRIGGARNLLKTIAAIVAAIFMATNGGKILGLIKSIIQGLMSIRLSTILAFGAFLLLFLIIEDIYQFMKGNKSVLGEAFKRAGIDADEMREKIRTIGKNLITIFQGIWNGIKAAFSPVINFIKAALEKVFGPDIFKGLGEGVAGVIELIERITTALAQNPKGLETFGKIVSVIIGLTTALRVASGIFGLFGTKVGMVGAALKIAGIAAKAFGAFVAFISTPIGMVILTIAGIIAAILLLRAHWDTVWNAIKTVVEGVVNFVVASIRFLIIIIGSIANIIISVWDAIISGVTSAVIAVYNIVNSIWNATYLVIARVVMAIYNIVVSIWNAIVSGVTGAVNNIINIIVSIWNAIVSFVANAVQTIYSNVISTWNNVYSGVSSLISQIASTIISGFNEAIAFITSLPGRAIQWGADFISGLISGITSKIGELGAAVASVGSIITGPLHFSRPDYGPLRDYEQWMPDFMKGLANGIYENRYRVNNALRTVATDMSAFGYGNGVTTGTSRLIGGSVSNSRSVNQNVNINNTFNGDRAIQQKAEGAMTRSAQDVTAELARGLSYAR